MKKIALVGSTGSIGRQVIDVVKRNPGKFKLVALIANSSAKEFCRQLNELTPEYAALIDENAAKSVIEIPAGTTFLSGRGGAMRAMEECGADVTIVACGGFAGLEYSLKAAQLNLPLALANKETLVCGGDLIMPKIKEIMPVDSEHSAIWQCLGFDRKKPFKRLIITASGGAFRGRVWDTLGTVTPAQALNHPTWKMGAKITVDSATLLNKGFEVIEAHHLFGAEYAAINAVIHPQSIVHSMVEFDDGATLAQLSYPTMELPIQLALTYPERFDCKLPPLDFEKSLNLTFGPLKRNDYPMFDLALDCGQAGGVLPTALNAASEVAVQAFLQGKISFTAIYAVVNAVVEATKNCPVEGFEQLCAVDKESRTRAEKLVSSKT